MANRPMFHSIYMTFEKVIDQLEGPIKDKADDVDFGEEVNELRKIKIKIGRKMGYVFPELEEELPSADEEPTIDSQDEDIEKPQPTSFEIAMDRLDAWSGRTPSEYAWNALMELYNKCTPEEQEQLNEEIQKRYT